MATPDQAYLGTIEGAFWKRYWNYRSPLENKLYEYYLGKVHLGS